MRVTNSMIMKNSKTDINHTKLDVNSKTHQMQTQKKISRPSDDPVIAIRSLRYATSLNHINQYLEKNIEDAESWLDITETALQNMYKAVNDMHTLADQGANGTNTTSDLDTMKESLEALQKAVYSEGNADYAGRTIFTSYRTNCMLTFQEDEPQTTYNITEPLNYTDVSKERYYNGEVIIPQDAATVSTIAANKDKYDTSEVLLSRLRLSYKQTENLNPNQALTVTFTTDTHSGNYTKGTTTPILITNYPTKEAWEADCTGGKTVPTGSGTQAIYIKETGELILSDQLAEDITSGHATIEVNYTKTGFSDGELRPEYYFDCTINPGDPNEEVFYEKFEKVQKKDAAGNPMVDASGNPIMTLHRDTTGKAIPIEYDINYIVANNQTLTVNCEASEVFDCNILRDIHEMIDAVRWGLECDDKVAKIKAMKSEAQYADDESQHNLQVLLEAAEKEQTYSRDNLQKLFEAELGRSQKYLDQINLATTVVGNKGESLALTKTRVASQQETIEELKSTNENEDLSTIMLEYSAAYVAYQAALTAASRIGEQSLLNYI